MARSLSSGSSLSPSGSQRAPSARLPPFRKLLFPAFRIPNRSKDLAALSAGLVRDLAGLMARLGDVLVIPLVVDPAHPTRPGTPETQALSGDAVDRMLYEWSADYVIGGELRTVRGGLQIDVELLGPSAAVMWADSVELVDGLVQEARLVLAANVVEAATGRRKDVRRARQGGTRSVDAYKRLCFSRFPRLDLAKKRTLLEEATEIDPDYAEAKLLLADRLEAEGRRADARRLLRTVAREHPRFSWARQRYGVALRVSGRPERAIEEVQAALDSDPDGRTLFHAGLFAEAGGDPTTAATLYSRAVERGCIDPILAEKLGRLRANEGKYADALALWERALELSPGMTHLLGNVALALHHLGEHDEAGKLFEQARIEAPDKFTTHANHAVFLQDMGRHEDAIVACDAALAVRGDSARLLNARGVSRMALGDSEGARADFLAALRQEPDPELATYIRGNLGRIDHGDGTLNEAARLLRQGAELVQHEQPRKAIPLLAEALDLHHDSWQGWLFLALAHRDLRNWEGASEALREVLRLQPRHAEALSERALALLALGRGEEALDHARLAVQCEPENPAFRCNLGVVLMEGGDLATARTEVEEAARLDPSDPVTARCLKEVRRRNRRDPAWGESWHPEPT